MRYVCTLAGMTVSFAANVTGPWFPAGPVTIEGMCVLASHHGNKHHSHHSISNLTCATVFSSADDSTMLATAVVPDAGYTHVRYALVDYPECAVVDSRGLPLAPFLRELECVGRCGNRL
jgi:hypothetical protein